MKQVFIHEVTHVLTQQAFPRLATPQGYCAWLIEGIALYEAQQYPAERPIQSNLVSIKDIDQYFYPFGYLLISFIIDRWGIEGLHAVCRASGDLATALDTAVSAFDDDWHRHILESKLWGSA